MSKLVSKITDLELEVIRVLWEAKNLMILISMSSKIYLK